MTRSGSLAVGVMCCAATVVYVLVGYLPGQRKLTALRAELERKQQTIDESPAWAAELARLDEQARTARERVAKWQTSAPRSSSLSEVLSSLSLAAAAAGAELISLQPLPGEPMGWLRREQVQLEVAGPLHAVHEFLCGVERCPQSVWVDRLELLGPQGDGKDLRCELSLSIFGARDDISD